MGMKKEANARFPSERIKSSCKASIRQATEQTEQEKAIRNRVFISSNGSFVATEKKFLFMVDRRNYHLVMALFALAAVGMFVLLLLEPISILTLLTIVAGIVALVVIEALVFMRMKRASVIEFDRASVSVEALPGSGKIILSKAGKEEGGKAEKYEITVFEGEEFPAL